MSSETESTVPSHLPPGAGPDLGQNATAPTASLATASVRPAYTGPTKKVSWVFLTLFMLAFLGAYTIVLSPVLVTLAVRVSSLVPAGDAGGALGIIVSAGALFAMFAQPFFGRLSDSTTSRFGMRRPWLVLGLVGSIIGTLIMALASNTVVLGIGFFIVQGLIGALGATLFATVADWVPSQQRGVASGMLGITVPISLVLGSFLVQAVSPNVFAMFTVPLVGAIPIIAFVIYLKDRRLDPADKVPFSWRAFFGAYWVNPIRFRNFGLVWWGRFFFILAYAFLTTYQAFFLITKLGATAVSVPNLIFTSTLVLSALTILSSLVAGKLSDVVRNRKIFVIAAAIIYGVGLLLITQSHDFNAFLVGMAVAGFGFGAYSAVDGALLLDVLPDPNTAAKDLAVGNISSTLPQSLAPAVAPLILAASSNSYTVLYVVAAVCAIVSAAFIIPIKSNKS